MPVSITLIVAIVSIFSGILGIFVQLHKMRKESEEEKKQKIKADMDKDAKMLTMLDNDKKRLDKLEDGLSDIKESIMFQSDMIYQMLDHMATSNNTGGMKDALDKYNRYFRRNL